MVGATRREGRDDRAYAVAVTPDGDYVTAGHTLTQATDCDIWVARYHPDGNEAWTRIHDGPTSEGDAAFGIAVAPNGAIAAAGHGDAKDGVGHMWTRSYDPDGSTA